MNRPTCSSSAVTGLVLAALILCQVIGGSCPMMPPSVPAAVTVQAFGIGHAMAGATMCAASLPSSTKSGEAPLVQTALAVPALGFASDAAHRSCAPQAEGVQVDAATPLSTRLTILRI